MNHDYVAEILRVTGALRSGDPAGVTAVVQKALALAGLTGPGVGIAAGDPTRTPRKAAQMPQTLLPGRGHTEHHSSPSSWMSSLPARPAHAATGSMSRQPQVKAWTDSW